MIRIFLDGLFVVVFLILSIPVWGVMYIYGLFNPAKKDLLQFRMVAWAFRVVCFISGIKLNVSGVENIPDDKGVVFVGNHSSIFDIVVFWGAMKKPVAFVAKSSIKKVPLLYTWMKLDHCVFLNRDDPREAIKTITEATENVKKNINMFIFPEGTRSKDGMMGEFKNGSLKIASRANAPVVPVAFSGTRAIFEDALPFVKKGQVNIKIGQPQLISELSDEDKKNPGSYFKKQVEELRTDLVTL